MELLRKEKVNVNNQNVNGQTPLSIAAERGFSKAILCLMKHGADSTIVDNDGALVATENGRAQIVLNLLDHHTTSALSTESCDTSAEGKHSGPVKYIHPGPTRSHALILGYSLWI